jgi:spore germination protein GerM
MKGFLRNKPTIQQSLLLTILIAFSIWAGSRFFPSQRPKVLIQVTNFKLPTSQPSPAANHQQNYPQVYWLQSNQNKISLVAKLLPPSTSTPSSSQQLLTMAIQNLLTAAPSGDLSSTIPQGTKLLSLQALSDGVHIDLSPEFQAGGGSTSMIYRVAQVLYTASSLNPAEKVFISIAGQPIDGDHPFGGEGLILSQPLTRSQFAVDFFPYALK